MGPEEVVVVVVGRRKDREAKILLRSYTRIGGLEIYFI